MAINNNNNNLSIIILLFLINFVMITLCNDLWLYDDSDILINDEYQQDQNHHELLQSTVSDVLIGTSRSISTINHDHQINNNNSSKKHYRRGHRQRNNKNGLRLLAVLNKHNKQGAGAWPTIFNVASMATISVNATCGQNEREEYCKMIDAHPNKSRATQCGICDSNSSDKRHPIQHATDGSNQWWQSPTLLHGNQFEYVTITMDLKQIYQVVFIMIKSGISPRPASWILERSIDNENYYPWQYFGTSDSDCRQRYGLPGHHGNSYGFKSDSEIICSTMFSKPTPLEKGEIHLSLINYRPGASTSSKSLLEFSKARYIRIRLQGMHTTLNVLNNVQRQFDLNELQKRSFYSIKTIKIGARAICSGHASKTRLSSENISQCECLHNTSGMNCEKCSPLHNQEKFKEGTVDNVNPCEKCECNGHANECYYDSDVEANGLSINSQGIIKGGGVCVNCTNFSSGINCEKCLPYYYRPYGMEATKSCLPCQCNSVGSLNDGSCNPIGGQCLCKNGFIGKKCDECDIGYTGAMCNKCDCDARGTMPGGICESHCQCKLYVEGKNCDQCISGYFGLNIDNPEGCMTCYCSGVTHSCVNTVYKSMDVLESLENWRVTDISSTIIAFPTRDNFTGNLVFGMYELPDIEAIYWLAPSIYTGNLLQRYGSNFMIQINWIVVRGDTSGQPTAGPSIILIGRNGLKIAYGDEIFHMANTTMNVNLNENGWYHVPRNVKDIVTRLRRNEYHGDPVTRIQFMSVLSDVENIMFRGTFHTDQVESVLSAVTLYSATNDVNAISSVERCNCPIGYMGLSCEQCSFGFTRIYENSSTHERIAKCIPCDCNGHVNDCDLNLNTCGECLHNTYGERCERCSVGYYGNAMYGTENDCIRCGCPLTVDSNNFSPSCQLKELSLDLNQLTNELGQFNLSSEYVCTQCPEGYTGDHCEICDDGFYGSPTILNSTCVQCPCNGGPCDSVTGRCISCFGNTEGWHCERCKAGYWGDPFNGCELCNCHDIGSISNVCDSQNGQCLCNERYIGHHCDECAFGYGNVSLNCPLCGCNENGSSEDFCDTNTGQCPCKMGIDGLKCDKCMDEYFGLTDDGCEECRCNPHGSINRSCNKYGQCFCRPNIIGRACDRCHNGYWNIQSELGCKECVCNEIGSKDKNCNQYTGQCNCHPGIGGIECDQCLVDHYGFSLNGCKKCDKCTNSAYICDSQTGRCVCPTLSKGVDCQQCYPNSWGWEHQKGCKSCKCENKGSIGQSCDLFSGSCICREGYTGRQCDVCAPGYYGYPDCQRCNCNRHGSLITDDFGIVQCDELGQCPCKSLVTGLKCEQCRQATYDLYEGHKTGCLRCFCFDRSQECEQSNLTWGQIRSYGSRNLSVEYIPNNYKYVVVTQIEGSNSIDTNKNPTDYAEIEEIRNLHLIPSRTGNVSMGTAHSFDHPLYFQLPTQFTGDRISSYGGYLKYGLQASGGDEYLDEGVLLNSPLVQIHSHKNLILEYYDPNVRVNLMNQSYVIGINETLWKNHFTGANVTRAIMMIALQNVKSVFVRGTIWSDFTQVIIQNVTLDSGIYISGTKNNIAHGVESCKCSAGYNGTSCQDPALGYYRWKNPYVAGVEIHLDDFIGTAYPCNCNGRSEICDPETGQCLNCRDNTGGIDCGRCADGFYGDPKYMNCEPCPCPETNRNFARGCTVNKKRVSCMCKPGYTGPLCDKCAVGYFGQTDGLNGKCEPCDCEANGVYSDECNEITGQCNCKEGLVGRRCDRCDESRYIFKDQECRLCDNCTLTLLDRADELLEINEIDIDSKMPPPWERLYAFENISTQLTDDLTDFMNTRQYLRDFNEAIIEKLQSRGSNVKKRLQTFLNKTEKKMHNLHKFMNDVGPMLNESIELHQQIQNTIKSLEQYGLYDHHINLPLAVNEAEQILENILKQQQNDKKNPLKCALKLLDFWSDTSEIINDQFNEITELKRNSTNVKHRLNDAAHIAHRTKKIIDETIGKQKINLKKFDKLSNDKNLIKSIEREMVAVLNNPIVPKTDELFSEIDDNKRKAKQNTMQFIQISDLVTDTNAETAEALNKINKNLYPRAKKHSENLKNRAQEYAKLFLNTKNGAELALRASNAYSNIVSAIKSARQLADQTVEAVLASEDELYNSEDTSVVSRGKASLKQSNTIQENAMMELRKLKGLEEILDKHEKSVDTIKTTLWQSGIKNNEITSKIQELNENSDNRKIVYDRMETAKIVSDQMRDVRQDALNISTDIYKLKQKFASLEPQWDTKFGMAEENVSQSQSNLLAASNILKNIESQSIKYNDKFELWNNTVNLQMQELRDKIAKAKHAAEGIRVSVESKDEISCIRSYVPHNFGLTTSNTIKLSFALSRNISNSPILFIEGENSKFIALELVKQRIRFIWNLGGGIGSVTHSLNIRPRHQSFDDAWYQIEANRTMNLGSIKVRQIVNNNNNNNNGDINDELSNSMSSASTGDYTQFELTPTNRIWIGGVPSNIRPKELMARDNGLGIVVQYVYVDNDQIGLWHFAHSQGDCSGATLGAHDPDVTSSARHFNGEGYAAVIKSRSRPYKRHEFYMSMTFKTLDQNALLFLAVDEKNNRSVSLTLFEGTIIFRIDYGGVSKLEINTTNRYNTGRWISIEAAREFKAKRSTENGRLKVNSEEKIGSPTSPITSKLLPDLVDAVYYLGGLPPGFKSGTTKAPGADHAYLGCMKDIQIMGEVYDPLDSSSYFGVEPNCKDSITISGYHGTGYVELPSHSLRKRSNFAMVFRTLQSNALIMLSAYPPQIPIEEFDKNDQRGNMSVSLIDGRVQVWINGGQDEIELISNQTVNDGEFHVLSIQKHRRKFELRIDDELQKSANFKEQPFAVNLPEERGGLYFGGAPQFIEYENLAPTFEPFKGAIKDIIFNNRTILFSDFINFTNVDMGRTGPEMGRKSFGLERIMKNDEIGKSFTATPEGCHRVGIYSYEPNAFKFGDGPFSHSVINVATRHLWQTNFIIRFDFRTYYPNGIIFLASGTKEKPKHLISLILRNGQLTLMIRSGRKKKQEYTIAQQLNDGQWHHVLLTSFNKKLTIQIEMNISGGYDGGNRRIPPLLIRLPKRINAANLIFIGGVSETLKLPSDLLLETFKGCIRRFRVNNATQDLALPGRNLNVGQCFPQVEKGSYFPGDAYAIYKKNFNVDTYLEMGLEFRTSELNGILLSVSETIGFPALSIELYGGKIVMSCDLGDGNPFRVETNNLPSKFTLCDNQWHNISAQYDSAQIVLRIDNQSPLINNWPYHHNYRDGIGVGKVITKSPLYIGGIPDIAPSGTVLNRENFKGCIRNVVIRNELKDWTDMDELHNVLLNECLAIH